MNKIVFEIEDYNGNTMFSFMFDTETKKVIKIKHCSVADIDADDIFNSDAQKIRIQSDYE